MVGEEGLNHLCRKKFAIEQWYMCMYIYIICNYHIPILQYLSSGQSVLEKCCCRQIVLVLEMIP